MPSALKPLHTHTYIDEIMTNIQKENVVEATTQLSKLFDAYKENNVPMEQIKAGGLLLCSMSYKLINEPQWEASDFIHNETLTYAQIQNSKSVRDLFLLLSSFIHSTINRLTRKEIKVITL